VVLEQYVETGFNYRMTDLQAAVGLVQLRKLPAMVARRRELAARYQEALGSVTGVRFAQDPPGGTTNYQSFWVLLPDDFGGERNDVLAALAARGISARRGIMASHLEPAYAGHPGPAGSGPPHPSPPLPATELLSGRSLILPLYHDLSRADQDRVIGELRAVLSGAGVP
jgi:perosamine synthetase